MNLLEVVRQVRRHLEESGRVSYRMLRRQFDLEDDALEERTATVPALDESIRLLASERFEQLTCDHIHAVANYRPIEIEDEVFFERAFAPGKEAAASLADARTLGREVVLDDLRRLRDTLG